MQEKSRLSRLVAILTVLQSKRLLTASELGDRFDCSVRTIYRDIRALEQAGVPIYMEEGKGYKLIDGYSLPPVMFSEEEANALITANILVSRNKDESLVHHHDTAITKIKAVLSLDDKDKADLLLKRVTSFQNISKETSSSYLSTIQRAITDYCPLDLEYHSFYVDEVTHRVVEPLALYHTRDNWIMIAWCRLRIDLREFRLDRIRQMTVQEEQFERRTFDMLEYFQSILQDSKGGRAPLT